METRARAAANAANVAVVAAATRGLFGRSFVPNPVVMGTLAAFFHVDWWMVEMLRLYRAFFRAVVLHHLPPAYEEEAWRRVLSEMGMWGIPIVPGAPQRTIAVLAGPSWGEPEHIKKINFLKLIFKIIKFY